MKTLYESLRESLCEDFFDNAGSNVETTFKLIDDWCKNNVNGDYVIDEKTLKINSPNSISIVNKKFVEFPSYIHFGTVYDFTCSNCPSLKSLKGAPEKVVRNFYCNYCTSLESLEGAPKEVGRDFYCINCTSLKTLEGAPKHVNTDFYCNNCTSLKSLKGAPKEVGRSFYCDNCTSLASLEGAPKKVGWNFSCNGCTSLKSLDDILTHVKGKIYSDIK